MLNKYFKFLNVCSIFYTFLAGFWHKSSYIDQHNYTWPAEAATGGVLRKKMFCKKFCKFHRKTPLMQSLFNKVVGLTVCDFINKRPQHRCFLVKFAKFLRTLILKIIFERLLLDLQKTGPLKSGRPRGHRLPLIWIRIKSTLFNYSITSHVALLLATLC